jgi:hypothetical protein
MESFFVLFLIPSILTKDFKRILWHNQGDDHPKINLANFGYISNMYVNKIGSFYILGYLLELIVEI